MPIVLAPIPFMLAALALLDSGTLTLNWPWGLGDYSIFASIAAVLCVTVLLQHQTEVSDHVLWMGSLATVILLTLLIPAEDGGEKEPGCYWSRKEPFGWASLFLLSGGNHRVWRVFSVLAPYVWLLIFATDFESRIVSADSSSNRSQRGRHGRLALRFDGSASRCQFKHGASESQPRRTTFWIFRDQRPVCAIQNCSISGI